MSFKFCLDNEIHACSHAPQSLEDLLPFLQIMFRDTLPSNPSFYYLDDQSHKVYIKTEEDYQQLLSVNPARKIKFYIISHDKVSQFSGDVESVEIVDVNELSLESSSSNEYEVMEKAANQAENVNDSFKLPEAPEQPQESPIEKIDVRSQSDNDEYEKIQEIQENHSSVSLGEGENQATLSTTESRAYSPEKNTSEFTEEQEARFKELIRETIRQEIPYIISEVSKNLVRKESVDKEIQCSRCEEQQQPQRPQIHVVVQEVQQVHVPMPEKKQKKKDKSDNNKFLLGLRKIGQFFKNGFMEISDIGAELFDDLSMFIEGDPMMLYSGGKFPKSYIEKAQSIAVIYPDANLHEVMTFIKKHPKKFTVDQVTELYIMKELLEAESATTRKSNQSCAF